MLRFEAARVDEWLQLDSASHIWKPGRRNASSEGVNSLFSAAKIHFNPVNAL